MASPNLSEVVTMTLRNRSRVLADNVSKNVALWNQLNSRGKVRNANGGRTIVQEIEYAENSTYKRYSGYETLNISPSDVFTAAEYDWKQAAVAVTISGLEELQNAGEGRSIDLLESRIANAERTMVNNLGADSYSDGTADGGKQIGGLQLLVPDDPTSGTAGGINRATWDFWRNNAIDASSAAVTKDNIKGYMNQAWLAQSRGTDSPDLIVADNVYYSAYWESLQEIQRITDTRLGKAGFNTLRYKDAEVVFDGGYAGACPAKHMYFLNCDFLYMRPHSDRNMVPLNPDRFATNQDAMVKLVGWAGNMTMSNAFLQGVLFDNT